jgi:hypothetical protein
VIQVGVGWLIVALVGSFIFGRMCKARTEFEERLEELEVEAEARARDGR